MVMLRSRSFVTTSLRVFTLPSSLKRRCPHRRGYRGTPPFQLAQRKGKGCIDLSRNRQSFLTTSSALLHCATPMQSTKYDDSVADVNMYVRFPEQVECLRVESVRVCLCLGSHHEVVRNANVVVETDLAAVPVSLVVPCWQK